MSDIVVLHYPEVRAPNWLLLQAAAKERGLRLQTWFPHELRIDVTDSDAKAARLHSDDAPKMLLHRTVALFRGLVIPALELWQERGCVMLNAPRPAYESRDKLLTTLALQRAGIPVVATVSSYEPGAEPPSFDSIPVIVKPAHGVGGRGIQSFVSWPQMAAGWGVKDRATDYWRGNSVYSREHYLIQKLILGGGRDIRAFVVADTCVGIMSRVATTGDVRANLTLGGEAFALSSDHPGAAIAVAAIRACRLDYGGVDLIEDENGQIRVLEVDAWAGFAGISDATNTDVAGAILDLLLAQTRSSSNGGLP